MSILPTSAVPKKEKALGVHLTQSLTALESYVCITCVRAERLMQAAHPVRVPRVSARQGTVHPPHKWGSVDDNLAHGFGQPGNRLSTRGALEPVPFAF